MNIKELEKRYLELLKEVEEIKQTKILDYLKSINIDIKDEYEKVIEENKKLKKELEKYKYKGSKINKLTSTKEYKEFRKQILKRDNYICRECGSNYRLQVHHIKSKKEYPELIMNPNNCITLCVVCHSKTENYF